jgi:SAM-dependent methyltransferase
MKIEIQQRLNSVHYPQNYYYDIVSLEPHGLLSLRLEFFKSNSPELFLPCDKFLDIGSSLGYFLFFHSLISKHVVGIEQNKEAVSICQQIKNFRKAYNVEIISCRFCEYLSSDKYDLIFIGNCFHYLYKDEGWSCLQRIYDVSTNFVVIELPMEGKHIVEIGGWDEDDMSKDYTRQRFEEESKKCGFKIIRIAQSGTAGNRNIVVMKK